MSAFDGPGNADRYMSAVSHLLQGAALIEITLKDLTPEEVRRAPRGFTELSRMTSVDEALALCERFGGMEMNIPPSDSARTRLTEFRGHLRDILSEPSYDRFLAEFGGTKFVFPRLDDLKRKRRNRLIAERIDLACAQKESVEEAIRTIVRDYGMHRRHVYRILKKPIPEGTGQANPSNAPARSGDAFSMPADSLTPKQPKPQSGSIRGLRYFLEGADKT